MKKQNTGATRPNVRTHTEIDRELKAAAKREGMTVDAYCRKLIEQDMRNPNRIQVARTPAQFAIFKPAAEENCSTMGELILALACSAVEASSDEWANVRLESDLWRHGTGRYPVFVDESWGVAGFPVAKKEVSHA